MIEIILVDGEYLVALDGSDLGRFKALIDASVFALQMLHDGPATSVTLLSGVMVP